MTEIYKEYIEWKKNRISKKDKKDDILPSSFYMTGNEAKFVSYLLELFNKDDEFKKMMLETGNKVPIFEGVYHFLKQEYRGKEEEKR